MNTETAKPTPSTEADNLAKLGATRCLLISITGGQLLLPSAVVAEVIRYREAETPMNEPDWLLGLLSWRNRKLPLLSLEKFFGSKRQTVPEDPRIIVLYGLHHTDSLPFYAFITQNMPQSLLIKPNSLHNPKTSQRAGLLASVGLSEQQTGWLPDLEYLEKQLSANLD